MLNLQEIIARGKYIFEGAPKRLEVFKWVNGRLNAKEIALKVGKTESNTLTDLQKIRDMGLIIQKEKNGMGVRKNNSLVYEKVPLARQIPISYFKDPIKGVSKSSQKIPKTTGVRVQMSSLVAPSENQILQICTSGEDQLYEFKSPGVDANKITKEIAAMLNTKMGGVVLYGVEDDGTILGSDKRKQGLDQPLQNSIKNNIAPAPPSIKIVERNILGALVLLIIVPPWNKRDVYHFNDKVLIRKGTNVFGARPEESRKLHDGKYVV